MSQVLIDKMVLLTLLDLAEQAAYLSYIAVRVFAACKRIDFVGKEYACEQEVESVFAVV